MKQFVLAREPDEKGRVALSGGDYRYLVRARRLAPGERFPALLPDGSKVSVLVRSVDGSTLVGEVDAGLAAQAAGGALGGAAGAMAALGGKAANAWAAQGGIAALAADGAAAAPRLPPIFLLQAIPKGEKMDLVVRQAAEGAVAEVVPFESEFSDVRISGRGVGESKFSRWERIVREARQQSGSATATAVRRPVSCDGLFDCWEEIRAERPGTVGLLFHHLPVEERGPKGAGAAPSETSLHGCLSAEPEAVALAIGPEGGFSPAEVERFLAAGFRPFTIGDTVLRVETAALYAQAAVRILLLERDSWKAK